VDSPEHETWAQGHAAPMQPDPPLPVVFTLRDALRMGVSAAQARTRVGARRWHRLRPGVYCRVATWEAAGRSRRHALEAAAVALSRRSEIPSAFSHVTAAALLGLPVMASHLERVHLTVPPVLGASTRHDDVRQGVAQLISDEITTRSGLPTTTAPRTVADCLRHLPPPDAVAVADAALHARLLTLDDVEQAVLRQSGWPYAAVAALAMPLLDGRRESALESRSAVVMHRFRLPPPACQVTVVDAASVIEAEKDRQARLEALGLIVVRWGWRHLEGDPPPMVGRLREALARGDGSGFTGRAA
jgi:hypothetical protein